MIRRPLLALFPLALLVSSPALAQTATDRLTPTIPETQIEPAALSSPYEFLSVATSASDFVVEAAALANKNAGSEEVKAMAAKLSAAHAAIKSEITAAGKADGVEVAKPAMDGEQSGLIGKMEALKGAEFDKAYVASQIFGHQRAIAYYRGYANKPNGLGAFAAKMLPTLVKDYIELSSMGDKLGAAQPAAQ